MEYIRWNLVIWTLMLFVVSQVKSDQDCRPVPYSDIKEAAFLSRAVYEKNTKEERDDYNVLKEGDILNLGKHRPIDTAQATADWKVVNVIRKKLKNHDYEPLKALIATSGQTTAIVFMGTDKKRQLILQAIKGLGFKKTLHVGGEPVEVMRYFLDAFEELLPDVQKAVKLDPTRKYIVSGHSLGGAIATLYALKMTEIGGPLWQNKGSVLITFGAPRVGNERFARLHDNLIRPHRKLRMIYNKDPVPHIPTYDYEHSSREIWIKPLSDASDKKWTSKLFDLVVCQNKNGDESKECSNSWALSNFKLTANLIKYKADHDMEGYLHVLNALTNDKRKLDEFENKQNEACLSDPMEAVP